MGQRERERERERDRQKDRETETETERGRQTEKDTETEEDRETERQRDKETKKIQRNKNQTQFIFQFANLNPISNNKFKTVVNTHTKQPHPPLKHFLFIKQEKLLSKMSLIYRQNQFVMMMDSVH